MLPSTTLPARPFSITLLLLLAACAFACGQPGTVREISGSGGEAGAGAGPVKTPEPLRVLNWNVHNFFNNKDDSAASQETIVTASEYLVHRRDIGVVIKALDPDIAVLQEVENLAVLSDLVTSELGGAYTAIEIVDGNDPRGIDIGVISKVPITSYVSHQDEPFTLAGTQGPKYYFARDCPEAHLDFNGREVVLLGVHFKAKDNDPDSALKRLAEAQRTRAIADALLSDSPERAILVLGDFNDTPGSEPYLAVLGEGAASYKDAPDFVPAADRWTYDYQGKLELVDHQMASPLLAGMLDGSSVQIRHSSDADAASDHAPIVATYMIQ